MCSDEHLAAVGAAPEIMQCDAVDMTMSNGAALNAAVEKSAEPRNNGCNGTPDGGRTIHTHKQGKDQ